MRIFPALALLVAMVAPASAFMLYPDRDDPEALVVLIEQPYGELVPFRALPPPFDTPLQMAQGPDRFSYRWVYAPLIVVPRPPQQEGLAFLTVDEDGLGTMHFEFFGEGYAEGEIFGAAATLVDAEAKAMHTFYARADATGEDFGGGSKSARVRLAVTQPADWWRKVDGIVFFNMKYQPGRFGDADMAWTAMRRAVERVTEGAGTEQRGVGE